MSSHYNTEPPPTASATLLTTAGPLHISLFAKQAPFACKNFLQHCLDGYYDGTTFHRVVPHFIIQGGDPTGTGAGGASIYDDPEFEFDPRDGEKVVFKDELHSRLRFNRRGLVGMAKSQDGSYGSQFFVTLANADRELTGTCTMFGRVEGDGIYNVIRIAEGELVEGTERPVYAVRVTACEVGDLGPFKGILAKRGKTAIPGKTSDDKGGVRKKRKKGKGGKALLSFGEEEEEETIAVKDTKPKFNTRLFMAGDISEDDKQTDVQPDKPTAETNRKKIDPKPRKRLRSTSPAHSPSISRKLPRDPLTQLPLPDQEVPLRSLSPSPVPPPKQSALSRTNAEIASIKASMRRIISAAPVESPRKETALESLIPKNSIRGRKRPPSSSIGTGSKSANGLGVSISQDTEALRMFNAFKTRLESANAGSKTELCGRKNGAVKQEQNLDVFGVQPRHKSSADAGEEDEEGDEAQLCDLHFISNCQSCRSWDTPAADAMDGTGTYRKTSQQEDGDDDATDWMTHVLTFGKDTLGKDLSWKREHEDADTLVVIDPREKEREIVGAGRRRERERQRKVESGREREWDRNGR